MQKIITSVLFIAMVQISTGATIECNSVTAIKDALSSASAGDEIVILDGTYNSTFQCAASGTVANPIVIRGKSPSGVHLKGSSTGTGYAFHITGDWIILKDLELTNAQKGLVFDNANHCTAYNIRVHYTGMETFHVRDGSTYIKLEQCDTWDTGYHTPGYSEGYYVGTDRGSWGSYNEDVNHVWIKDCKGGPDVRGELFDIKEGSWNVLIDGGNFDGSGISGDNYADSFVDLKGTYSFVRNATFDAKNDLIITKGIAVLNRTDGTVAEDQSGKYHVIHGCQFFNTSVNRVSASSIEFIYAYDNTGGGGESGITGTSEPDWYAERIAAITDETQYPAPPLTAYDTWMISYGLSGSDAGLTHDYDEDGANNLYEYGLDGNPTNDKLTGMDPVLALDGADWIRYIHLARTNDASITYTIEHTFDLIDQPWSNSVDLIPHGIGSALNLDFQTVTNRIPMDGKTNEFLRLRIDKN